MKKTTCRLAACLALAACLWLPAVSANAVSSHPMNFSTVGIGFAGAWWDLDTFGDSLGGNVFVWWTPIEYLGIQLRTGYFDKTKHSITPANIDAKIRLIPLEAGLTGILPLHEHFRIYGGGGVGWYSFSSEIDGDNIRNLKLEVDDTFGVYAIAGLMWEFTEQLWLFGEARYTHLDSDLHLSTDGTTLGKWSPGISGFGATAGLIFGF